jgi:hypothetical protein
MNEEYLYYEMCSVGPEKWENRCFQILHGTKEVAVKVEKAVEEGRKFLLIQLGNCIIDRT